MINQSNPPNPILEIVRRRSEPGGQEPPLGLNEYQQYILSRARYCHGNGERGQSYAALGLAGEAGEVVELVKKAMRPGNPEVDRDALSGEMGDVLYYLARLAASYDLDLEQIAFQNIPKVNLRNPESGCDVEQPEGEVPSDQRANP